MAESSAASQRKQEKGKKRLSWLDKKHGIQRVPKEKQPPSIHEPFNAAASTIPSQFLPEISKFLREKLRIQNTGHNGAICEPGYVLQHTARYFEVDEAQWMLVRPRFRLAGEKYRFLFHAHHFMVTFSGALPHPSELDELAGELQEGVLASLYMEEDVSIEFFCTETNTRRIYPPLKSGHKLRYLFASEFPDDPPPPADDEELEGKLEEFVLRDAIKTHNLTSPALRNRDFEWVDDMGSSGKGKEKALALSSSSEGDDEDE